MKKKSSEKTTILFCRDKYENLETQKLRLADYTRIKKVKVFDFYMERMDCGESLDRWTLEELITQIKRGEVLRIAATDIFQISCYPEVQSEFKILLEKYNVELVDLSEI
jgi:hypothetical protein